MKTTGKFERPNSIQQSVFIKSWNEVIERLWVLKTNCMKWDFFEHRFEIESKLGIFQGGQEEKLSLIHGHPLIFFGSLLLDN